MKNAVIIGVSDRSCLWRFGKIKEESYQNFVNDYALFLSERFDNLIVTPDDGVYTDIALKFGEIKGKKPIAYYPDQDKFYGIEHIKQNFSKYELRKIDGDWYKLNAELTKQADIVICLGFSPGVLIEGCFIKYHQKYAGRKEIKWLIDERCIDVRLPGAVEEQIKNLHYYSSLDKLEKLL